MMSRQLYVGNLGNSVASFDLENLFGDYGTIVSARVKTNPVTGKCSGCGIVEMGTDDEADAAIAALHGSHLDGRAMSVRAGSPPLPGKTLAPARLVVAERKRDDPCAARAGMADRQ
jgi:RNA recognition motif-containing protein